jgi:elongation factor Ts
MSFSASDVMKLREKTGSGMMDCKKALVENNGDFEASVDWLRKKGLSAAAKKSDRVAAEGLVALSVEGNKGSLIELNSETDFVAKNDKFQNLALNIVKEYSKAGGDVEAFKSHKLANGKTISEEIAEHVAVIGENMTLRRAASISVANGVVASYVHNAVAATLGKIGVLIALESTGDKEKLAALGRQIGMHIAAAKPEALSTDQLDSSLIEKEKELFKEQAKASGKPDNVIEKMVEGRIVKFYEQVVLLEQIFVLDGKTKVSQVIKDAEKDIGAPVKLTSYVRFTLGEGVEKKQSDFAQEVAAAAGM